MTPESHTPPTTSSFAVEDALLRELGAWSAASVIVGSALVAHGHHHGQPAITSFGRQHLTWGLIDAAIAGAGWARRGRRDVDDESSNASRLRRALLVNAVLDVGYIAFGTALIAGRHRVANARRNRDYGPAKVAADGAAIVQQGAFLLVQDVRFARRLTPV